MTRLCNHKQYLWLTKYDIVVIISPMKSIKEVLILETKKDLEMGESYCGELLRFIRIWLKISSQIGFHFSELW